MNFQPDQCSRLVRFVIKPSADCNSTAAAATTGITDHYMASLLFAGG
jgi:hypothetical protein